MASLSRTARALALTTLLASPLAAQDAAQMQEQLELAYTACMSEAGNPDATSSIFTGFEWIREDATDEGLIYFYSPVGEDPYAYMADDGSFCAVESISVDSITASETLAAILGGDGGMVFDYSKDDMGCTRLDFANGATATITSTGDDPTCGSDTDSAVRFDFGNM